MCSLLLGWWEAQKGDYQERGIREAKEETLPSFFGAIVLMWLGLARGPRV